MSRIFVSKRFSDAVPHAALLPVVGTDFVCTFSHDACLMQLRIAVRPASIHLMDDGAIGTVLVAAGSLMVAGTALAFNRAGFARPRLGPWSIVVAYLAFTAGVLLALYGLSLILSTVSVAMATARTWLYFGFIHVAWASLMVLPMVLLDMPMNMLLAFRPVVGMLALLVVEIFFGASLLTHVAVPVVLILTLLILRVDWSRGRLRVRTAYIEDQTNCPIPASECAPLLTSAPAFQRPLEGLYARLSTQSNTDYGNRPEYSPNGPARGTDGLARGSYALPMISIPAILMTLFESILLVAHALSCNSTWLNTFLAAFAIVHGGIVYAVLRPSSTFV